MRELGDVAPIRIGRRLRPLGLLTGTWDIHRMLRQDWDLVQVQSPVVGALSRLLPTRAPLIYVAHGFHVHRDGARVANLLYGAIERALAGRASAVALVSAEDFDQAKQWGFHRRTCLWRLPGGGVDLGQFPLTARAERNEIRLVFIGELNSNKDPLRVIDVVRHLRGAGHAVSATLVGDGPLRDEVAEAVQRSPDALRWVPQTVTPERFLQEGDLLLMPSRREGLPRVVIEALATGRSVVARSNRGARELLRSPSQGRLMAPDSTTTEWADAVLAVAAAPSDGKALRASVQQYGVASFTASYGLLVDTVLSGERVHGAFDRADQEALR